jgi:pyrimidine deaminase RibD-like protein
VHGHLLLLLFFVVMSSISPTGKSAHHSLTLVVLHAIDHGYFLGNACRDYMRLALNEALKCTPVPSAFCVGAVIVDPSDGGGGQVLSTGYSRELPGNTHAEACALDKLAPELRERLGRCAMYTTMEPCSVRLSGNTPCVQRILDAGIRRVYVGTEEPPDFVVCEGTRLLRERGVEVTNVPDYAKECLDVARRTDSTNL